MITTAFSNFSLDIDARTLFGLMAMAMAGQETADYAKANVLGHVSLFFTVRQGPTPAT
jgi:hypothetical protein